MPPNFSNHVFVRKRRNFFEIPRVHVAAAYMVAISNSLYSLCNISTSNYRSYKGGGMVCGSAVGRQIPVKFVRKRRNFLKFLVSMLPLRSL